MLIDGEDGEDDKDGEDGKDGEAVNWSIINMAHKYG